MRVHSHIVVLPLVLEEEVLVGPVRRHKLCVHVDLADELLGSAQLDWLVERVDSVESLASWHLLEFFLQVELGRVFHWAGVRSHWFEAQVPGEDWLLFLGAVLGVRRKVGEAHRPDEVCLNCEVSQTLKHDRGENGIDVGSLAVLKEVQAILTVEAISGH